MLRFNGITLQQQVANIGELFPDVVDGLTTLASMS
jgi:hypothetical protein